MKEKEGRKKDRALGREGRERRSLLFFLTLPPAPPPFNACYYLGKVYSPRRISRNSLFLATRLIWSNIFCHHFLFIPCAPCSGKSKFGPVLIINGFFLIVSEYFTTHVLQRRLVGILALSKTPAGGKRS